jgi:pectinesterase
MQHRTNRLPIIAAQILFGAAISVAVSMVASARADTTITVAADGSGQFTRVQDAIMSVPDGSADNPVFIRIKPGTYKEPIYVQREKRFFHLIGEDPQTTILTYDLHANMPDKDGKPIGTFRTPSTTIDADDFTAENLTFENTAGPVGQALALRIDGDRAVFRNCRFLGNQDTIFVNRGRQLFDNCYIEGTTDFIFGGATAYFRNCHIHCKKSSYITAAATPDFQPYGFVFDDCRITAESPDVKMYLGRPWRGYSAVTFMDTEMPANIRPAGWHNWDHPEREQSARYAEYHSTGPGANPTARVPWSRQLTDDEARRITPQAVLSGSDGWGPKMAD